MRDDVLVRPPRPAPPRPPARWRSAVADGVILVPCARSGGMGLFNTLLTGPGVVIVQSMSLEKMQRVFGGPGGGDGNNGDNGSN